MKFAHEAAPYRRYTTRSPPATTQRAQSQLFTFGANSSPQRSRLIMKRLGEAVQAPFCDQYWSRSEAVLVAISYQYWFDE